MCVVNYNYEDTLVLLSEISLYVTHRSGRTCSVDEFQCPLVIATNCSEHNGKYTKNETK